MAQQKHTQQAANRNSTIVTRRDRNGKFRTETAGRDSTNSTTDSTILFVDSYDGKSLRFDGREARTIYRALQKHYKFTSKSW